MSADDRPEQRNTKRDAATVRGALMQAQLRLSGWHERAALLQATAVRRPTDPDRSAILRGIKQMRDEVAIERTDLIAIFMDQPSALAGHSRVNDVERSLDQLEAALAGIELQARR